MRASSSLITVVWELNRGRIVAAGLLCLMAVGFYAARTVYLEPALQALTTEQSRLQQQVRKQRLDAEAGKIPVSTVEQLNDNLRRFNELIPPQEKFSAFIGELHHWAVQSGLKIHQINFRPHLDLESGYLLYGLNFSLKGRYRELKQFIHRLENASQLLVVDRISLSGSQGKGDDQEVALQIGLTVYFQGDAA